MALVEQINCDNCGRVLVGSFKAEKVSRSYLEVRGYVCEWISDPHSGWREKYYITRKPDDFLTFCTEEKDGTPMDCFGEYRSSRVKTWDDERKRQLMREASERQRLGNPPADAPYKSY